MWIIRKLITVLICALLTACGGGGGGGGSQPPAASGAFDPGQSLATNLDGYFTDLVSPTDPGAAVLAVQNGQTIYRKAHGMADLSAPRSSYPGTQYNIGSVSKQFTALAVLLLYERGLLNLNDSVRAYLPELDASWAPITVHHLLSHQAGIPDYLNELFPADRAMQMTNTDVVDYFTGHPELQFAAGVKFKYSNSGFVLAAEVVARISGMSFGEFLAAEIFDRLDMTRTVAYDETRPDVPDLAVPYRTDRTPGRLWMRTVGDGGVVSTVDDLARYFRALRAGELVSLATLEQAWRDQTGLSRAGYGYGWNVGQYRSYGFLTHGGRLEGFTSRVLIVAELDLTIVVLTNSDSYLDPIGNELGQRIIDYHAN